MSNTDKNKPQPEQPISEEGKDKKYWRDRWFYIIGHNPGRSVNHIEDLIEEMMNYYSPSPSQEAIELIKKAFDLSVCDLPDDEQKELWDSFKRQNNL